MSVENLQNIKFKIRHTMLPVSDLNRSIDFYTHLLGMDLMRLREQPEENLQVGYLGYGSEDDGPALELIQNGTVSKDAKMAPWSGHVALHVSNLYELCEILKQKGVTFVREPGPKGPGRLDLVAFIQDPDGYNIELTERHTLTGPPLKRA